MKRWISLACCLLWAITAAGAEKPNFKIVIVDEMGAAIQAEIFVRTTSSSLATPIIAIALNRDGTAELELKPGVYDVFVGANGFDPYARKIEVLPNKPVNIRLKLKVSLVGANLHEYK